MLLDEFQNLFFLALPKLCSFSYQILCSFWASIYVDSPAFWADPGSFRRCRVLLTDILYFGHTVGVQQFRRPH